MNREIGIDIGGTSTKCIGHNNNPRIISSFESHKNINDIVTQIIGLLDMDTLASDTTNIGLAITGLVDTQRGYLVLSNNLGYKEKVPLNIVQLLCDRLGCEVPIYIYNDGDAAAFAEAKLRGLDDAIMVTLGTSPGGGIIKNGEIYGSYQYDPSRISDPKKVASEVGSRVHPIKNIAYRELLRRDHLATITHLDPKDIGRISSHPTPDIMRGLDTFCDDLASLFIGLMQEFGQTQFILGGGLTDIGADQSPIFLMTQRKLAPSGITLEKAKLGNKAGMIGAKFLAKREQQSNILHTHSQKTTPLILPQRQHSL